MSGVADFAFPLLVLGALHGLNPAMGWLFAVARGLQQRDRRSIWTALGPLALGHGLAISVAVVVAFALGRVIPLIWMRWSVAVALVTMGGIGLLRHRHISLGGMRVGPRELVIWSFLVATAHGAGLMVLPLVLGGTASGASSLAMHHHGAVMLAGMDGNATGLSAPLVHTAGYIAATAAMSVLVYEKLGVRILRRAWINLNALWGVALIVSGVATALL